MSCGCNNNGWGTVQYAPPACNPNFPTACTPLGTTNAGVRVVVEDQASCKYTVTAPAFSGLLNYNASTTFLSWATGSSTNPIFLAPPSSQVTSNTAGAIEALSPTGQLVAFAPTLPVTQTQFPIFAVGATTPSWGSINNIFPNTGVVYVNSSGVVEELSGAEGQLVSFDANGNAIGIYQPNSIVTALIFG